MCVCMCIKKTNNKQTNQLVVIMLWKAFESAMALSVTEGP